MVLALGDEGRVALSAGETEAVRIDVVAQRGARVAIAAGDVAHERIDHGGRCVEEHVVHPRVKDALLDAVRNNRVPVVGDRQDHGTRESHAKLALERLAGPLVNEEARRGRRKDQPELCPDSLGDADGGRYLRSSHNKAAAARHTGRTCATCVQ